MLTWSTKWKTMVAVSILTVSHYNSYSWELSAVLFIFRKWCSCSIGLCFLGMPNSLHISMFLYYSITAQSLVSDACVHHSLFVSYGTHQSCTIYTEAPSVWIFHFHTVFIMKRLLKCRQILIWKAAASSRHMHAHRVTDAQSTAVLLKRQAASFTNHQTGTRSQSQRTAVVLKRQAASLTNHQPFAGWIWSGLCVHHLCCYKVLHVFCILLLFCNPKPSTQCKH